MTGTVHPDDRAAMKLMGASATGRVLDASVERVLVASRTSWARTAIEGTLPDESPVDRAHAVSLIALVASIVALMLPFAGTRSEPLAWVVPAVVMLMALVVRRLTSRGEATRA